MTDKPKKSERKIVGYCYLCCKPILSGGGFDLIRVQGQNRMIHKHNCKVN